MSRTESRTLRRPRGPRLPGWCSGVPGLIMAVGVVSSVVFLVVPGTLAPEAVYSVFGIVMSGLAMAGVVRRPRGDRFAWLLLALGMIAQAAGDAMWFSVESLRHQEVSFPSVADLLYLSGYPLWAVGVVLLVRRRGVRGSGAVLDTCVFSGGVASLQYHFLIAPYLADTSVSLLERWTAAAYPMLDLFLVSVTVLAVTVTVQRGADLRLLILGLVACFAGDIVYGLQEIRDAYTSGGWLDLTWMVNYTLLATAVWVGSRPGGRQQRTTRWVTWRQASALAASAVLAPIGLLLVIGEDPEEMVVLTVGTIVLTALVGVRLAGLLLQVSRQAETLAAALEERERIGVELRFQATHDALTGLANRHHLSVVIDELLGDPGQRDHTVVFLDLDGFRELNDRLGHAAGDEILVAVARRAAASIPPEGLVGRLGGDEFAVLLRETGVLDAVEVAGELLEALTGPIEINGSTIWVRASTSVVRLRTGGRESHLSCASVFADGDVALHDAKRSGGGQVTVYRRTMRERMLGAGELAAELLEAIEADRLHVVYQPLTRLRDGAPVALEALVRWDHPRKGAMSPADFLPVALDRGLIDLVDLLVLRHGLTQLADWRARLPIAAAVRLNVNTSAPLLAREDFVPTVRAMLAEHGLPGSVLTVELTEQVLVSDADTCARRLAELRELGVGVALDDFGTGYSSLAYLERFPVDQLKLDRTFIALGTADGSPSVLLRAVLELATTLGLEVVAEGIESAVQRDVLAGLGCAMGQGFLFARPMPSGPAEHWLSAAERRHEAPVSVPVQQRRRPADPGPAAAPIPLPDTKGQR